jgi:tetrahedral aminopeptidase
MITMELLKRLSDTVGPSGYETEVRTLILKEMKKYVDEVSTDKIGNLICHKKGRGPKIMLASHMDEIGLIVTDIREDGKLKFTKIGGVESITYIGQKVDVIGAKKKITGAVSFLELHEGLHAEVLPSIYDLYVDTGLTKKELKRVGVTIGSAIVAKPDFGILGSENFVCGKALDDRLGCYVLIELARRLKATDQEIYYVFTVQEEIGLHGARVSVYEVNPDWGIAVDTTDAEDAGSPKKTKLGAGPAITVKDCEVMSNVVINNWLQEIASKNRIPIQLKVDDFGTTDMASILLSKESVPSTAVNIPVRNIHSSIGISHRKDIENTIKLLYLLLRSSKNRYLK